MDRSLVRILVISNLYPNRTRPTFGTFVAGHVEAMRRAGGEVDVVAIRGTVVHRRILGKYLWLAVRAAGYALMAIARRRRPHVVEAHIAFPTGLVAWPIARLLGARLIIYCHGSDVTVVGARSHWHRRAARFMFGRADLLVANSSFTRSVLTSAYSASRERIRVWTPGIDTSVFKVDDSIPRAPTEVLFVGRLDPGKGVGLLIEAIGRIGPERATLRVIGDGSLRLDLEQAARRRNVHARFEGGLPAPDVASAMARATVLAVPSTQAEGLGLVAIEGLACGCLVVASASGGLEEIIVEGRTGWLVPPGNAGALATALEDALDVAARADGRAGAIRAAGYALAARHDVLERASETLRAYDELRTPATRPLRVRRGGR